MKKLNEAQLFQCKYVSDLFLYSTKKKDCSSKVFIKSYIYSSISKRIAKDTFLIDSLDVAAAYEIIKNEKKISSGKEIFPSYVMAWIGYIIKYFECYTGIPQSVLYKKIKPKELYSLYESYHSLDNELVIKRIAEAKGINIDLNNVELMRKVK